MATQTIMTDDLDGTPDATTVSFSFDGRDYEIDLAKKNRAAMEKALKPYFDAARSTGARARRASRKGGRPAKTTASLSEVRTWAAANGYEVSARGRVSQQILDAYQAAR